MKGEEGGRRKENRPVRLARTKGNDVACREKKGFNGNLMRI